MRILNFGILGRVIGNRVNISGLVINADSVKKAGKNWKN